jgi:ribosomal protein S18 acetylase RimI-like enzyme
MLLREATAADAATIARLHAESWRATYRGAYSDVYLDGPVHEDRAAVWQGRLATPRTEQFVVIAEEDGEPLGFACAYGEADERLGTLLDNLHVRPGLHRRGIGRQLVLAVAAWCSARYPNGGLHLGVLEQNTKAQAFYRSLGAADVGGGVTTPPGGGSAPFRTYAWTAEQTAALAAQAKRRTERNS